MILGFVCKDRDAAGKRGSVPEAQALQDRQTSLDKASQMEGGRLVTAED